MRTRKERDVRQDVRQNELEPKNETYRRKKTDNGSKETNRRKKVKNGSRETDRRKKVKNGSRETDRRKKVNNGSKETDRRKKVNNGCSALKSIGNCSAWKDISKDRKT